MILRSREGVLTKRIYLTSNGWKVQGFWPALGSRSMSEAPLLSRHGGTPGERFGVPLRGHRARPAASWRRSAPLPAPMRSGSA